MTLRNGAFGDLPVRAAAAGECLAEVRPGALALAVRRNRAPNDESVGARANSDPPAASCSNRDDRAGACTVLVHSTPERRFPVDVAADQLVELSLARESFRLADALKR